MLRNIILSPAQPIGVTQQVAWRIILKVIMATAKDEVLELLKALPEDATLEDVQYSIYVRERIERARAESLAGSTLDQDEVETRMSRWLKE